MSESPQISLPAAGSGTLERLAGAGILSVLDYHFARSLAAFDGASEPVLLCAAFASRAVQLGHVCVHLDQIAEFDRRLLTDVPDLAWPASAELRAALERSALCSDGSAPTPLVLDARGRLYLHRYAMYERSLARALRARARLLDVPAARLQAGLSRLFPVVTGSREATDAAARHRLAALVVALHPLAVICGGPGTGKTTTVVKILALLQELSLAEHDRTLNVLLLAPTGKAAERLASSVKSGLDALDVSPAVRKAIPSEALTLHRALGFRRGGSRPRHDADNPLPADLVLIDEVSMVDVALLHRVISAVRPHARLILQGDKDQLSSVEAGAILGDIYDRSGAAEWSAPFAERVREISGDTLTATRATPAFCDCLVHLEHSFRYGHESGIGRVARAVNAGDAAAALRVLGEKSPSAERDCTWFEATAHAPGPDPLQQLAIGGYEAFIREPDPEHKLRRFGAYRVLCAHRQGRASVTALNAAIEGWLERAGLIRRDGLYYENRPIVITQNDYGAGLFNGDIGIVIKDERGRLRVCFEGAQSLRFVSIGRLPPHETVFAMTIHKSQGSEFDRVSIVLPEHPSALVGRELLYTAVTRARKRVDLFAPREVIVAAVERAMQRASGLWEALWSEEQT